jgi:hypothetical protein
MREKMELTLLVGFQAVLIVIFVFLFGRLEKRVDSLARDVSELRIRDLPALRHDLAEEFRAQRAEAAAQIAAIASAINASRS